MVKKLAVAYKGSSRNICMDNYFTTLSLAKQLLSWNLTLVGTLKKNKPYIPSVMAPNKSRKVYSTVFEKYTLLYLDSMRKLQCARTCRRRIRR